MIFGACVLLPIGIALGKAGSKHHIKVQIAALLAMGLGVMVPVFADIFRISHGHGELKTIAGHKVLGFLTLIWLAVQAWSGGVVKAVKRARGASKRTRSVDYLSRKLNVAGEALLKGMKKFHQVTGVVMFILPYFVVLWGIVGANGKF